MFDGGVALQGLEQLTQLSLGSFAGGRSCCGGCPWEQQSPSGLPSLLAECLLNLSTAPACLSFLTQPPCSKPPPACPSTCLPAPPACPTCRLSAGAPAAQPAAPAVSLRLPEPHPQRATAASRRQVSDLFGADREGAGQGSEQSGSCGRLPATPGGGSHPLSRIHALSNRPFPSHLMPPPPAHLHAALPPLPALVFLPAALSSPRSLDLLQLEKPGALGVCLDGLWGRVASLDIRARELLLGVPVAGE